jgi:hypothetical protein
LRHEHGGGCPAYLVRRMHVNAFIPVDFPQRSEKIRVVRRQYACPFTRRAAIVNPCSSQSWISTMNADTRADSSNWGHFPDRLGFQESTPVSLQQLATASFFMCPPDLPVFPPASLHCNLGKCQGSVYYSVTKKSASGRTGDKQKPARCRLRGLFLLHLAYPAGRYGQLSPRPIPVITTIKRTVCRRPFIVGTVSSNSPGIGLTRYRKVAGFFSPVINMVHDGAGFNTRPELPVPKPDEPVDILASNSYILI